MDDETVVTLQSLSRFSDGLECRGCRPTAASRNQVPLMPIGETRPNHVGRNRNRPESHFRGSFGAVTEAVAEIRSASSSQWSINILDIY